MKKKQRFIDNKNEDVYFKKYSIQKRQKKRKRGTRKRDK